MTDLKRLYQSELPSRAIAVYLYLRGRANKEGVCWPAIPTMARELKMSESTIRRALRDLVREEVHQPVIQGEQPLLYGKADGSGGQALGEGEHGVGGLRVIGLPMALGKDLAVAQQHKAVHLNAIAVELIQQVQRVLPDDDALVRGHEDPLGPVDHLVEHVDQILNIVRHLNLPSLP